MTSALSSLEPTTHLTPPIHRLLGFNPSPFTLQGTNTYLLGTGPTRLLLDTAQGLPAWKDALAALLETENASLSDILLTHWHPDHVGGVADTLSLPRAQGARVWKFVAEGAARGEGGGGGEGWQRIADGQVFAVPGAERGGLQLRALHSPGHTVDHCAFVLETASGGEVQGLFTGDNVLGHGTAVFEDLAVYLRSLGGMREVVAGKGKGGVVPAFPGHGDVVADATAKLDEYLAHRRQREEQVLAVLGGEGKASAESTADPASAPSEGGVEEGFTSMAIVRVVYAAYPAHLHAPAEGGVVQVLGKLAGEGRVEKTAVGRWKLADMGAKGTERAAL